MTVTLHWHHLLYLIMAAAPVVLWMCLHEESSSDMWGFGAAIDSLVVFGLTMAVWVICLLLLLWIRSSG